MNEKPITNLIFELGMLKKFFHNGPKAAGIKKPDTIAEHSFRAAVIGYILAEMEGLSGEKTACMLLFHDIPEARIGDHNKIAQRYINTSETEKKVIKDQVKDLPDKIAKKISNYWSQQEKASTKEGKIARDADYLETAFQAKEYSDTGYPTKNWISNVKKNLKTKSAKKLIQKLEKTKFTDWWKDLKI
jgi:putative hydrolase of HD superfamily